MDYRHNWAEHRVYFQDDTGRLVALPASWTDVLPPDPFVVTAAGRSALRVDDLLELAGYLEELSAGASR